MLRRILILLIAAVCTDAAAMGQGTTGSTATGLATGAAAADTAGIGTPGGKSFFSKLIGSLSSGNVDRTYERPVDMSFVAYPSYSHEPSFGIGAALTALYRTNRRDSTLAPSDAFVTFNASIRGFLQIYGKGNHLFADRRSRLRYVFEFHRMPLSFWGIDVEAAQHNAKSKYERFMADIQANYTYDIIDKLYVGPALRLNYTGVGYINDIEYLAGERKHYYVTGLGVMLSFDNRDHLLSPSHGIQATYRLTYYSKALSTVGKSFLNQTFIFNYYTPMWRGSVLALDAYGSFNTANVPWTMREMIASDGMRMRGYYMGSYMGKNQVATQVEYRQHVYKRFGFTLWGGCGTLYDRFSDFRTPGKRPPLLPNYGLGLRFEVKKKSNIRLDCGFGRNDFGITFNFGEAF